MNISFRRVASTLALVAIISFATTAVTTGVSVCHGLHSCAAAVTLSDTGVSQTTPTLEPPTYWTPSIFPAGIEIVALYTFILALIIFVAMEFYRPHLLKRYLHHRV